jgi:hypothetical protein
MAKIRTRRGFRYVKELGGAINRSTVSFAARWLVEHGFVRGRVLDYGCGFGFDADHFGWEAFDPWYRQREPTGEYDTIICNHVLNMLTRATRHQVIHTIQQKLAPRGKAWLILPRNIPVNGKVAMRKRIQNYVVFDLPSVYVDRSLEIYRLGKSSRFSDRTREIELRLKEND